MQRKNDEILTDTELLQRFNATKDNKWLGLLLPRYTYLLLGVCMKYLKNEEDAKDSVQQIFLKVISELRKHKVEYFKSWIYMVAKNHCLMKLRTQKENRQFNEELLNPLGVEPEVTQKRTAEVKENQLTALEEALKMLNKAQRDCLVLFYMKKRSYAEISQITGYTVASVKSHLQNGKRKLKILMEEEQRIENSSK